MGLGGAEAHFSLAAVDALLGAVRAPRMQLAPTSPPPLHAQLVRASTGAKVAIVEASAAKAAA